MAKETSVITKTTLKTKLKVVVGYIMLIIALLITEYVVLSNEKLVKPIEEIALIAFAFTWVAIGTYLALNNKKQKS